MSNENRSETAAGFYMLCLELLKTMNPEDDEWDLFWRYVAEYRDYLEIKNEKESIARRNS